MYRYQILIEYDGKDYVGWQKQKNGKSIQSQIQNCMSKILKEKIKLYGSGRTDSGVHAINQSAHFDTKKIIINLFKLKGTEVLIGAHEFFGAICSILSIKSFFRAKL